MQRRSKLWRFVDSLGVGLVAAAFAPGPARATPPEPAPDEPTPATPGDAHSDAPAPPVAIGSLLDRLQERLDAYRETTSAPGACLAVILPGGEEVAVSSGCSHRGSPDFPMSVTDRMPSGSVGKTYCAALTLMLRDEGVLELDAPITRYLDGFAWLDRLPNSEHTTVRMLLNHTSGLREHVTSPEFIAALRADPARSWTAEELVAFALDTEALFAAGAGWSYADTNFVVLGLIIETATGRAYNDLLRERILEPLGLVFTDPTDQPQLPGLIPGYTSPGNPFGAPEQTAEDERYWMNPQFEYTGGGTLTTTIDLARWGDHLYGGRLLGPESLAEMVDGIPCTLGPGVEYGLGTIVWPSGHGPVLGHAGWFPGYISMLCYYPELGVSVAYQQNSDVASSLASLRRLIDSAAVLAARASGRVID